MATAESQARSLDPDPLITLYQLDLRPAGATGTSSILYLHDGIAQGNNQVTFGGHVYTPYPVKAEEFEWSTQGTLPRPKLSVSNVGGITSALCREYGDLVGCILTRIQTFKRFLAGQPEANATQTLPIQKFVIERKSIETNSLCSFDLSIPSDAEGVSLPRRLIISNTCIWRYRGPECTYSGLPVTNRLGAIFGSAISYSGTTSFLPATFADGNFTADSRQVASDLANFQPVDVGKAISDNVALHPYIEAGTTIQTVQTEQLILMDKPAKATGVPISFTIAGRLGTMLTAASAGFSAADVGVRITGSLFPAGTNIKFVRDATHVDLNKQATSNAATTFKMYRLVSRGTWNEIATYAKDDWVTLLNAKTGIIEVAVSRKGGNQNHPITDEVWWWMDVCLKKLSDCKLHFGTGPTDNNPILPYGGFPGAHKVGS
jgi:lambda family phage minor tail protein L